MRSYCTRTAAALSIVVLASICAVAQQAALQAEAFMTSFHYSHWDPDLQWVQMCGYTIGVTFQDDKVKYDTLFCEDTWLKDTIMSYITPTYHGKYWLFAGALSPLPAAYPFNSYHIVDSSGQEIKRTALEAVSAPVVLPYGSYSHLSPDTLLNYSRQHYVGADSFPHPTSSIATGTYPTDDGNYAVPLSGLMHNGQLHAFALWSDVPGSNTRHQQPWLVYGTYRPFEDGQTFPDTFRIIRYYPSVYDTLRSAGLHPAHPPRGEPLPHVNRPARRTLSAVPVSDACGRRYYASDGAALFKFNATTGAMKLLDTLVSHNFGNRSLIIFTDNMPLQPNFYRTPSVCEIWLDLDFDRSSLGTTSSTRAGSFVSTSCAESDALLLDVDAIAVTSRPADSLVIEITQPVSPNDQLVSTLSNDSTYHISGSGSQRLVIYNDAFLSDSSFIALAQTGVRLRAGEPSNPDMDTLQATWQLHLSDSIAPLVHSYIHVLPLPQVSLPADTLACNVDSFSFPTNSASGAEPILWQNIHGDPISSSPASGTFTYQAIASTGCTLTDTLRLSLSRSDTTSFRYTACQGSQLQLTEHPNSLSISRDTLLTYRITRQNACDSLLLFHVEFSNAVALPVDTLSWCISQAPDTLYWRGDHINAPGNYMKLVGAAACPDTARLVVLPIEAPLLQVNIRANCTVGDGQLSLPSHILAYSSEGEQLQSGDWVKGYGDSITISRLGQACRHQVPTARTIAVQHYQGSLSAERIAHNQAFTWTNLSAPNAELTWQPLNPQPLDNGSFTVAPEQLDNADSLVLVGRWSDEHGCVLEDQLVIYNSNNFNHVGLPTAFSPNGDGINDIWKVYLPSNLDVTKVSVFDRKGGRVFLANTALQGWDGTARGQPAAVGVYVALIEYYDADGNLAVQVGEINLMR